MGHCFRRRAGRPPLLAAHGQRRHGAAGQAGPPVPVGTGRRGRTSWKRPGYRGGRRIGSSAYVSGSCAHAWGQCGKRHSSAAAHHSVDSWYPSEVAPLHRRSRCAPSDNLRKLGSLLCVVPSVLASRNATDCDVLEFDVDASVEDLPGQECRCMPDLGQDEVLGV